MDRIPGTGQVSPAVVASTVRSVITNRQTQLTAAESSAAVPASAKPETINYSVADLFGRCFLRVCYWVDVFASIRRRGEPLPYVPFTRRPLHSLAAVQANEVAETESTGQAIGTPPIANA